MIPLGAIDPPTATVIGAILIAALTAAGRMAPRTRTEASRDRAASASDHAQAWALLIEQHRLDAEQWRAHLEAEREGRRGDQQRIRELTRERDELRAELRGRDRPPT